MNKEELLEKIKALIKEVKEEKALCKKPLDEMYCIGKINGLLWAMNYILDLKEN